MAERNQELAKRDPLADAERHIRAAIDALDVYEAEHGRRARGYEHAELAQAYLEYERNCLKWGGRVKRGAE